MTQYFVELQGKDQTLYPLEGASCVGPNAIGVVIASTTSCLIPMNVLYQAPYLMLDSD